MAYTSLHLLSLGYIGKPASRISQLVQPQRHGHEGFLGFLFPPWTGRQVPRLSEPVQHKHVGTQQAPAQRGPRQAQTSLTQVLLDPCWRVQMERLSLWLQDDHHVHTKAHYNPAGEQHPSTISASQLGLSQVQNLSYTHVDIKRLDLAQIYMHPLYISAPVLTKLSLFCLSVVSQGKLEQGCADMQQGTGVCFGLSHS